MSALPKSLPDHATERQMRRLWNDAGWRNVEGSWIPTCVENGARVIVQEQSPDVWIILLDGTRLNEQDGSAMTWPDKFSAGIDALRAIRNDWHGPAFRFRPSLPWMQRDGVWMRSLVGAYMSGTTGRLVQYQFLPERCAPGDHLPVVVLRPSHDPDSGWGAFIGTTRPHVFETVGRRSEFAAAYEAREAADNEVGHWIKSQ